MVISTRNASESQFQLKIGESSRKSSLQMPCTQNIHPSALFLFNSRNAIFDAFYNRKKPKNPRFFKKIENRKRKSKTKILNRKSKIEYRISNIENRKSKIENRQSKIENRKSKIEKKSKIQNRKSKIQKRKSKLEKRSKIENRKSKIQSRKSNREKRKLKIEHGKLKFENRK